MASVQTEKNFRILGLYSRIMEGGLIVKADEAARYGVTERSIQRDLDDIRAYLETQPDSEGFTHTVIYDRFAKGYRLDQIYKSKLTNGEVLALCKILLDSRAFPKKDIQEVLDKLIDCCVPEASQALVSELISNEEYHYVEPRHKKRLFDTLWDLGTAIRDERKIEIAYQRTSDKAIVRRKLKPVALLFSEYYFYLTAFIDDEKVKEDFEVKDDPFPTIYRLDRIKKLAVLDERFQFPYSKRFEEGEFRKRVQFMYGGKLQRVTFRYTGPDIDAVLDRLPTAKILSEENGAYIVQAEVFGKGIDMWLRSQGSYIEVLSVL